LGLLKKSRLTHARPNVPALVQVAALAIIMIRCLDVLMILNTLGVRGIGEFIHRSVQTWNLTLVFLSSLVLVFIEIYCAFSLVKGRNWARWVYLLTQITAASYLWAASLGTATRSCSALPGNPNARSCARCLCKNCRICWCSVSSSFRPPVGGSSACNNVYNRSPRDS
jgi:hypothetical protein